MFKENKDFFKVSLVFREMELRYKNQIFLVI